MTAIPSQYRWKQRLHALPQPGEEVGNQTKAICSKLRTDFDGASTRASIWTMTRIHLSRKGLTKTTTTKVRRTTMTPTTTRVIITRRRPSIETRRPRHHRYLTRKRRRRRRGCRSRRSKRAQSRERVSGRGALSGNKTIKTD